MWVNYGCSCGDGSLGIPSQRGDNYECRNMKLLLKQQQRVYFLTAFFLFEILQIDLFAFFAANLFYYQNNRGIFIKIERSGWNHVYKRNSLCRYNLDYQSVIFHEL